MGELRMQPKGQALQVASSASPSCVQGAFCPAYQRANCAQLQSCNWHHRRVALLVPPPPAAALNRLKTGPAADARLRPCSNCGDNGICRCPYGRTGEGCEIDFLAPCRQFPDTFGEGRCSSRRAATVACTFQTVRIQTTQAPFACRSLLRVERHQELRVHEAVQRVVLLGPRRALRA